ncbi:MAG TPA: adenylate/guanylate cyclase domain-containing protein [Calditrichaeota bacterium]|nr:adenylate/guanylate cyclase domain-containing protein [Calditrichota bacterium]
MKKQLSKITTGAGLGLLAAIFVWLLSNYFISDIMYTYEAKTYDWRIMKKMADVSSTIEDIVIVDIDARSNQKLGKFSQWPRSYHTQIVKFFKDAGALSVGLDIIYDRETWRPQQDVEFVREVGMAGNVYNALYFAMADSDNFLYEMDSEPAGFQAERFYYLLPPEEMKRFRHEQRFENEFIELLNASRGVGHVNFNADIDGVVRRIHLFTEFNNHLYPSLAFKMFMDVVGGDSVAISGQDKMDIYSQGQLLAKIPIDEHGNMLINYEGPFKTFRYISFYDVLHAKERNLPPEFFKNKIILVGTSLPGLFDLRNVPFMQAFPGVEIHANILYTLLKQNFIHTINPFLTFLVMAVFGILFGIIFIYTRPLVSSILVFLAMAGYVIVAAVLFMNNNLWVEIVDPVLTTFFVFAIVYVYRYMTEEKKKRFIRSTFSHFVTKSVVDELLANPEKIKLGGEKKVCSVLFSDVAGFTTISEQLPPEQLVHLLNEYLTEMTNIVFNYHGMLDKYEGDAIMAVFGAPIEHGNHAYNACAAALNMQKQLAKMRGFWRKQGRPELKARIGINSGPMVVGNMGSETRFDYTVMGDAVNLGARLEPANKVYGTDIMIGEGTVQIAGERIIVRLLDLLRVKGKTEPVKVYELLGIADQPPADDVLKANDLFAKGFAFYLKQDWDTAMNYFKQALEVRRNDNPSLRYIKRCETFKRNPPGDNWDGVYTMTTK